MTRPVLLDTFACGGGAGKGYEMAGFDVYAIDINPKPLLVNPHPSLCMDALEAISVLLSGGSLTFSDGRTLMLADIAAFHASPPCQGYSIMNNLPWIRSRSYPLLILPTRELLEQSGKPYIIENVAGAASKKNLEKLGLLEHRLRAGWLCGGMFGLPIYRHRYFETNWFWPQPGHPKHRKTRQPESTFSPRPLGVWEKQYEAEHPGRSAQAAKVNTAWRAGHDGVVSTQIKPHGEASLHRSIHITTPIRVDDRKRPHLTERLPGTNGAQKEGVALGHAAGWKIAAEAMGIDWMKREQLTQAIPPVMTEWIGTRLLQLIEGDKR